MQISRKSALKTIGTVLGSATLFGFNSSPSETPDSIEQASNGLRYNVKDYGAKADGIVDDTGAINKAITAAADNGGGQVIFPAGTYLSGSVQLKSNITLYLGQGAVLEATDTAEPYDPAEPFNGPQYQDFGHSHWHNSLIWGENLHDVAILGPGKIYGKGLLRDEPNTKAQEGLGNKTIALKACQNVELKDFTIQQGGWFGILATGVDNFTIDNLDIDTNRDGIDIDCCRNVRVSNCNINSPLDDAICPKSSYALGYARTTQNLVITNCMVSGFKEGTMLDGTFEPLDPKENDNPHGRIKFGTESNGGFKNITISNCTFDHCRGIALETVDGGLLEDVTISNITMRDIGNAPIFMRLGSRMRGPEESSVGQLRHINISNVVVHNADQKTGVLLSGIPGHRIKDIKLSDIQLHYEGGGTEQDAAINPPENLNHYPEPDMFGKLPSYGIFLRHVEDIEVTNVKVSYGEDEARPPFALSDVKGADFRFIKAETNSKVSLFSLREVENFTINGVNDLDRQKISKVEETQI